mgnify:CR=1 FL=1
MGRIHILGHQGCPVMAAAVRGLRNFPHRAHAYPDPRKVDYHRRRLGGQGPVHAWHGITPIGDAELLQAYTEGWAKFAYPEYPSSACHTQATQHYDQCWRAARGLEDKKRCWQTARQTYRRCVA